MLMIIYMLKPVLSLPEIDATLQGLTPGDRSIKEVYPDFLEKMAVRMAKDHRKEGLDVALVPFARGKVLEDYIAYGKRNQFGGIVYLQKETAIYAIDLTVQEIRPVEIKQMQGGTQS